MRKERTTGHRRSARISALEEKVRILALEKQTRSDSSSITSSPPPSTSRKRGRKCKSLQAVVVNSFTNSPHQELEDFRYEDNATKAEQVEKSSPQRLPKKETLEFVLDILQRRDTEEIFAEPVDPEEVVGYYNVIKEPMDFGTMRAKLQEGMYTSLEQFERDVFLISSNAMKFNSSTTVYYTEARAINELAQRLFNALKAEPENFQLEYSRTRRRPGRKAQSEAGGSDTKPAKPGSSRDGLSLNDPPLRRATTQAFLSPPYPKLYPGQSRNGILPVSRDGRTLNSPETERRTTYLSSASFRSENEKIVSAVYNAPKSLTNVTHSGTQYSDSLMRFVKDLGPTAQTVANKKLGNYPIQAPNSLSWNPSSSFGLFPKPSAFPSPVNLNGGGNEGQMPYNFISNPSAAYKGKMVCTNGGTSTYGGESIPNYNSFGTRPYNTNGGRIDYNLLGDETANTSRTIGASSSKEITNGTSDSMDLLIATLNQIGAIQNQNNHTPSGTYYPLTGYEEIPSQINNASQSWSLNKPSEPSCLPYSNNIRSTTSLYPNGEGPSNSAQRSLNKPSEPSCFPYSNNIRSTTSLYPNGEGPSNAAPAALNQSYMAQMTQSVQPEEWRQSSLWGLPPICDLPVLQTHVNEQIPLMQQQQQPSQVPSFQDVPLFNTMNFLGGANSQGRYHRGESSSAQYFWNTQRSSFMDKKQPDLDLQL